MLFYPNISFQTLDSQIKFYLTVQKTFLDMGKFVYITTEPPFRVVLLLIFYCKIKDQSSHVTGFFAIERFAFARYALATHSMRISSDA